MMKSKTILKSKKSIMMLLITLAVVMAMIVPTMVSALASNGNRINHYMADAEGRFISDYATLGDAHRAGRELNQQIAEEGIVLLQNNEYTLPFGTDVRNISVFGDASRRFAHISRGGPRQSMSTAHASFDDSLTQAGFRLNRTLDDFYRGYAWPGFTFEHPALRYAGVVNAANPNGSQIVTTVTSANYRDSRLQPGAAAMLADDNVTMGDVFGSQVINSFNRYGDAALIVLQNPGTVGHAIYTRSWADANFGAGQGNSSATNQTSVGAAMAVYAHPEDHFNHGHELTHSERALIEFVQQHFDRVVVVINSAESWDIGWLTRQDGVGAILSMDHPGTDGILALGRILNGRVNPSGRTVNMFVEDTRLTPQWNNVGTGTHHFRCATDITRTDLWSNALFHADAQHRAPGSRVTAEGPTLGQIGVAAGGFDTGGGTHQNWFHEYEEGIYIGSRYFETRGYEMARAAAGNVTESALIANDAYWVWYDNNVVFPMGHGLSYTDFSWTLESVYPAPGNLTPDCEITVRVRVRNDGALAGRDVVQLYFTAPWAAGGIEKPFVQLAGFEKTRLIQPRQSQIVTISLRVQEMASWDWNNLSGMGANPNTVPGRWGAYVLESGEYQIRLMRNSNVRNQQLYVTYTVPTSGPDFVAGGVNSAGVARPGGFRWHTDADSGEYVYNLFTVNHPTTGAAIRLTDGLTGTGTGAAMIGAGAGQFVNATALRHQAGVFNTFSDEMTIFTRADFRAADLETNPALSWPSIPDADTFALSDAVATYLITGFSPTCPTHGDVATQPWMQRFGGIPSDWTQAATAANANPAITFPDMVGVPFADDKWDDFLNQWTLNELWITTLNSGSFGTRQNTRFRLPRTYAVNGVHGLQQIGGDNFDGETGAAPGQAIVGTVTPAPGAIASTWCQTLMYRVGRHHGSEARLGGVHLLYSLVLDLRRAPHEHRQWEVCSEDPFILGTRGMRYVRGAQGVGTQVQIKHFIMYNGGSAGQNPYSKFLTEQAFRELYAEPFRMSIVHDAAGHGGGGAVSIMTAYTRLGINSVVQNWALLEGLARGQWGFIGWISADMSATAANHRAVNTNLQIRSGTDQFMGAAAAGLTPIWDAALRGGNGSVRIPNAAATNVRGHVFHGIADTPESAMHYYAIRRAAHRVLFSVALSHVLQSSDMLYLDAIRAWGAGMTLTWAQNAAGSPVAAGSPDGTSIRSATGIAGGADISTLLPNEGGVTYRLTNIPGNSLPLGLELTPWGALRGASNDYRDRDWLNPGGMGAGGGATTANVRDVTNGSWLRESSTRPFEFMVDMIVDGQVRARRTVTVNSTSAFSIGDSLANGKNINADDIDNATPLHLPITGLTVGSAFNAQIQGTRADFHVADGPVLENPGMDQVGPFEQYPNGRRTSFSVVGGNFPAGLTLNSDGSVTGTPLASGQFDFTIQAHRQIRTTFRNAQTVSNHTFYIHATMVVDPPEVRGPEGPQGPEGPEGPSGTPGQDGAPGTGGCGGFALADSIVLFAVLATATSGLVLFVVLRNKKSKQIE